MGHLCSCHRQQKFDKGRLPSEIVCKSEPSLLYKIHIRNHGTNHTTSSPHTEGKLSTLPHDDDSPKNGVLSTLDTSAPQDFNLQSNVSVPPPKPPRMRDKLVPGEPVDGRYADGSERRSHLGIIGSDSSFIHHGRNTLTSFESRDASSVSTSGQLKMMSVSSATLPGRQSSTTAPPSSSSFDGAISALTSHAVELVLAAGVQPEVIVDYLHRKNAVNDETVAAVRRCATKRFACELIVEVVVSKGRSEMTTLVEAIRATGNSHVADCLETLDGLLNLRTTFLGGANVEESELTRYGESHHLMDIFSCVCDRNLDNKNQQSSISGVGQFEIEIVYVDSTSGLVLGAEKFRPTVCDKAVSAARSNCQRHRSVLIDPDTISLPSHLRALADSVDFMTSQDVVASSSNLGDIPVVSISLTNVCLSNQFIDKMAECLFRFSSFRVLSLVKCHRTGPCLDRLRHIFTDRKSHRRFQCRLLRLDIRLSRDVVDSSTGTYSDIGSNLSCITLRSLRSLYLTGSGLTSTGSADLFRNFVVGSRLLTELDIGFNDVVDSQPIADALAANCPLRRLRLRSNAIDADGAKLIFAALRRNYRLEDLDVSGNSFGSSINDRSPARTPLSILSSISSTCVTDDVGQHEPVGSVGRSLAEALVCNRTLRELHAERCGLGVDDCRGIARALLTNSTLAILDISSNPSIGDLGLAILSTSMSRNARCAIETLSMNMCSISDIGLESLLHSIVAGGSPTRQAPYLRHGSGNCRTRLQRIKLCYNNIEVADRQQQQQQQHRLSERHLVFEEHSKTREDPGSLQSANGSPKSAHQLSYIDNIDKRSRPHDNHTDGSSIRPCLLGEVSRCLSVNNNNNNNNNNFNECQDNFVTSHIINNGGLVGKSKRAANHVHGRIISDRPNSFKSNEMFARGQHVYHSHRLLVQPTDLTTANGTEIFRSASTTVTTASIDVTGHRQRSSTPIDTSMFQIAEVDTDRRDVYQLLCDVLAANPKLKVLLWGNNKAAVNRRSRSTRQLFLGVREEDLDDGEKTKENVKNDSCCEHSEDSIDQSSLVTSPLDDSFVADWSVVPVVCQKYATLPLRGYEPRDSVGQLFR